MQSVFLAEMDRLVLPAYLLTGSHEQAAQCFLDAWEDSTVKPFATGNEAFYAAKRAVIGGAVRRIRQAIRDSAVKDAQANSDRGEKCTATFCVESGPPLNSETLRHALMGLNLFERAVLVLRLYEGYSLAEAANLLGVSRQALDGAWPRALAALLESLIGHPLANQRLRDLKPQVPAAW